MKTLRTGILGGLAALLFACGNSGNSTDSGFFMTRNEIKESPHITRRLNPKGSLGLVNTYQHVDANPLQAPFQFMVYHGRDEQHSGVVTLNGTEWARFPSDPDSDHLLLGEERVKAGTYYILTHPSIWGEGTHTVGVDTAVTYEGADGRITAETDSFTTTYTNDW